MVLLYMQNKQIVKLSKVLKSIKRVEQLLDSKEYNLLGVRSYGQGVFHRETKKGKNIKSKTLYKVKSGDILYSRLGASTGSFAWIDGEFDNYYVSNEFPTFIVKTLKIVIPEFLILILTSERFYNFISVQNTGSVLKRFHKKKFLELEIPLPSLEEQQKFIKIYQNQLNKVNQLQKEVNDLKQQIEDYLLENLGIEFNNPEKPETAKLYWVDFFKMDRWDYGR